MSNKEANESKMNRSSSDGKSYAKEQIQGRKFKLKFLRSWQTGSHAKEVKSKKWPIKFHIRQWWRKGNEDAIKMLNEKCTGKWKTQEKAMHGINWKGTSLLKPRVVGTPSSSCREQFVLFWQVHWEGENRGTWTTLTLCNFPISNAATLVCNPWSL